MASDPTSRSPAPLKRFARLEMDGDPLPSERPSRPAPSGSSRVTSRTQPPPPPIVPRESEDVAAARQLATDLSDNARHSLAQTTPQARRAERAQMLRERVTYPAPSAPMPARSPTTSRAPAEVVPRGTTTRTVRFDAAPAIDRSARVPSRFDFEGTTPGVVVMEIDLREPAPRVDVVPMRAQRAAVPGVSWDSSAPRARAEQAPTPVELTPMAARQVMLMAWEAGMPGSGLRILTAQTPGLGGPELDFAFDDDVQDDDLVFLSHGVRVIVDRESLRHVRGRRITWHDVPGSEGFAVR